MWPCRCDKVKSLFSSTIYIYVLDNRTESSKANRTLSLLSMGEDPQKLSPRIILSTFMNRLKSFWPSFKIIYVCGWVYTSAYWCPWGPEEGAGSPGAGVIGGCEPFSVVLGTELWSSAENSLYSVAQHFLLHVFVYFTRLSKCLTSSMSPVLLQLKPIIRWFYSLISDYHLVLISWLFDKLT